MDKTAKVYDLKSKQLVAANDERMAARADTHTVTLPEENERAESSGWKRAVAKVIAFVILQPLLLLRMCLGIVGPLIGLSCLAMAFIWFGMDASSSKTKLLLGLGSFSLIGTTVLWTYDAILERLQIWLLYE